MSNILKETFGNESRWVNWRLQTRKGKKTKVPYSVSGDLASSTNPADWSTYDEALKVSENVGIVFTPEQTLLGIDIDHCLTDNQITHEQKEIIAQFIIEADTYFEISPSGAGLHGFLKLTEHLALDANRHEPYELYTSGRYFTVTNNPYKEERPVRSVSAEDARKLLAILGYTWKTQDVAETKDIQEPVTYKPTVTLDDSTILENMFASKNGQDIKVLWNGNIDAHEKDASRADMSLCAHLAFWSGRNATQMERLWLSSPLGQRKKTMERKDYRDRTIKNAIANCKEVYETPMMKMDKDFGDLDLLYIVNEKKDKVFVQNTENMCRILRKHPDFTGRLRYDVFKNVLEIKVNDTWRGIEDNDAVNIQTAISVIFPVFIKVGKDIVYDAIIKVSKENRIDSAADYIRALVWDKTKRLDSWLPKTYGVADDKYHCAVGSNWIKGMVKRITEPGCKFDYVLVLEGPQGSKKSTSLLVLGGDWHVETTMSTDSKDFFMQFQGKAIIEFSEGETLSRTEVKKMKAIITMQSDKFRPPYERSSQEFPRRCVFAMSTNEEEYLKDDTGNRRWLPVKLVFKQADVEWLRQNRDQILAEAYYRVHVLKETVYEFPEEEMLAAQEERRAHDENETMISEWYFSLPQKDRDAGITTNQVFKGALNGSLYGTGRIDRLAEMKIAGVLRNVLKLTQERRLIGNTRYRLWFDLNKTKVLPNTKEITGEEIAEKAFNAMK